MDEIVGSKVNTALNNLAKKGFKCIVEDNSNENVGFEYKEEFKRSRKTIYSTLEIAIIFNANNLKNIRSAVEEMPQLFKLIKDGRFIRLGVFYKRLLYYRYKNKQEFLDIPYYSLIIAMEVLGYDFNRNDMRCYECSENYLLNYDCDHETYILYINWFSFENKLRDLQNGLSLEWWKSE